MKIRGTHVNIEQKRVEARTTVGETSESLLLEYNVEKDQSVTLRRIRSFDVKKESIHLLYAAAILPFPLLLASLWRSGRENSARPKFSFAPELAIVFVT